MNFKVKPLHVFNIAFERVIGHEGGFQDDGRDRGNWTGGVIGKGALKGTKYGISAAAYPDLDIRNLSLADAEAIYKRDYWDKVAGDKLPGALAFQLFDYAVNSGVDRAIKALQVVVGVKEDGVLGPVTLTAVREAGVEQTHDGQVLQLVMRVLSHRLQFMAGARGWARYSKGWALRIAGNLELGARDV
ncbi:MAG: glycoside hydrolase family 108 protein [Gammaproteobacteria bacterium]